MVKSHEATSMWGTFTNYLTCVIYHVNYKNQQYR